MDHERADESAEVRDDEHIGRTSLDHVHRGAKTVALRHGSAAGHVQLFERLDQLKPVALASRGDTLALLKRRDGILAKPADTDDADCRRSEEGEMVVEGELAPDFTLPSDSGEAVTLSSLRGKPVALFFYPKDDTPGCTTQACGIRDLWGELERTGAIVLGVSPDKPSEHVKFREKYDLPFTLLSDTEHAVAEAYGTWVEKSMYGKTYMGMERSTFVIDADGNVAKIMRKVKPDEHADSVLAALA